MLTVVVIVVFIIFMNKLIKTYNYLAQQKEEIKQRRSKIVSATNSVDNRLANAIGAAGKFAVNETNANGLQGSMAIGHQRELNSSTGWNTNYSQDLYDRAFDELRQAITNYNKYISMFPESMYAYILGFEKEVLPDAEKSEEASLNTRMAEKVNMNEFIK